MIHKNKKTLAITIGALVATTLLACSDDDSGAAASSGQTAVVSGISTANSKLTATTNMVVPTTTTSSVVRTSAALGGVWTTANGVADLGNNGQSTLETWIKNMFDPTFTNSNDAKVTFSGRISNTMDVLCLIGASDLATDSTGLPADQTGASITLTAAMLSACGNTETQLVGQTVSVDVSTPTDTTIYDKYFQILLSGSNCAFRFLARSNSEEVSIASSEDESCDGRLKSSRSIVRYNITNQTFRFFYISKAYDASQGNTGFEYYRGYYSETTDEAYVLGFSGSDTTPLTVGGLDNYVAFTAAGRPTAGGNVAVSAQTMGMTITDDDYQGCISAADGTITDATDNLTCGALGGGQAIGGTFTTITNDYGAYSTKASMYDIDGTTDVPFTDNNDMF